MKTLIILLIFSSLPGGPIIQSQQSQPATTQAPKPALAFGLQDGTPLKLRLSRTLSSANAKVGETADFEVLEDVKIGDLVVIPRSGTAWATVTEAEPKKSMGRGGKLNVNIDSVKLVSGEKIALRAVQDGKGGGHVGAMTGAIVATSIVFFPAAPLFLFMKGKDITIPKGTEITAYVNGDVSLDPRKFNPIQIAGTLTSAAAAPSEATGSVNIKSNPDGAEISIDGKFVGNAPSTVSLRAGDHKIMVKKAGYSVWEREITVGAGSAVTLSADLEKSN